MDLQEFEPYIRLVLYDLDVNCVLNIIISFKSLLSVTYLYLCHSKLCFNISYVYDAVIAVANIILLMKNK